MKKILLATTSMLLFTGCDLFKDDGILNIQTMKNISIYIDGEFKTDTGENTKLILKEGTHKIKLYGVSPDGNWEYKSEEDIQIGGKVEKTITIYPTRYPTKQKIKQEQELLNIAIENGCKTYEDYTSIKLLKNNISNIENNIENIAKQKTKYFNNTGFYMIQNDFLEIIDFSIDKKNQSYSIKIKNNSNAELTYFWNNYYFLNENYELIGNFKEYKENILIKSGEIKEFKFPIGIHYPYQDFNRKLLMSDKIYLVIEINKIYLKDKYGKFEKSFREDYRIKNDLENISNIKIEEQKQKILEIESIINQKCSYFK